MSLLPNLDQMTDNEKLAVLESIQKSIAESKEIQKKKIGENVDLVVQALKKIESDIRDRFDAVGNSIEKRVLSIQDGRDGADGKDGRDGKDGKSGRDGLKGDRGVDGQAGRDGVDGVDGISVVNAQIDFDGSLVITLSDGRELNVGEVVSQDIAEKIKVISTMSTNGAVGIKDEGTSISTGVKTINFVGAAVTATNSGDDVTVNVSSGTGTVTSVALSGGTTGLTVSGSPITTSGTITLAGTLVLANGGTGATTASGARTALGLVIGTDVLAPTGSAASLTSFPTFNQNTTGSAATLTTARAIYGNNFDGSAALTQIIASTYGGTGNGFTKFIGATTAEKTYTLPDASSTIVVQGGALGTPSSGTVTNLTGTASININGTVGATTANTGAFTTLSATGVTTVQAGTAALPAITTTGDTNTGIFFPAADTVGVATSGSERLRVDSSGNVGIGVTPSAWGSGAGAIQTVNNAFFTGYGNSGYMGQNAYRDGGGVWKYQSTAPAARYGVGQGDGSFQWSRAASGTADTAITFTTPMTLDASGNLLVGTTTLNPVQNNIAGGLSYRPTAQLEVNGNAGQAAFFGRTNDGMVVGFYSGGTRRGSVDIAGATTSYVTSSDYRLKENIALMTGALTTVSQLKPVTYKWKEDGKSGQGFIAHELQAIVPECVTGIKDAVETYTDKHGNESTRPVYQGIDTSFLVATLTAAIQEQQALITALTARITALENK